MDLQSAQRQTVLTNDVIKAIPTAGSYNALLVARARAPRRAAGREHRSLQLLHVQRARHAAVAGGNRANTDGRLLVDGISIAVPQAGGTNYLTDTRNAQEVTFTVSGSMGEVESGGPVMNIIPRSGGNTLSGSGFVVVGQWRSAEQQPDRRAQGAPASRRARSSRATTSAPPWVVRFSRDRALVLRHRARPGQLRRTSRTCTTTRTPATRMRGSTCPT